MLDLDRFFTECQEAVAQDSSHKLVRDVVARAVSDPGAVIAALGEPQRAGINVIYRAPNLTVLNLIWGPGMTIMPHDHRMWAVIGIYTGRENNIFWRRLPAETGGKIEAAGAKSLGERDAEPLGRDIIHTVTNPLPRLTGAIHVYGGDFFAVTRSEWDPETLLERRYDAEKAMRLFAEANAG